MNKVLITKYLSSIKNDDLPIFGAVVINSNPSVDKNMAVELTTTEPFNVSELGGAEILNASSSTKPPITSVVIGHNLITINKDNSRTMHLIFNGIKYKPILTNEMKCFGSCLLDLSILKYQNNLNSLGFEMGSISIGSLLDLPSGITSLNLGDNSLVTGNIKDLPSGITSLNLGNNSLVTGNIKDLPSGITSLNLGYNSLVTGNIKDLPSGITSFSLWNDSLVTGNIKDLPSGITSLIISNSSTTGTLESYVEKLYNTHKNDGKDFTLSAHTESTGVTFNGASAHYLSITTISGGKATVRRGSEQGNILGTYDGTSWTYNS